jgi:hypothetical protein
MLQEMALCANYEVCECLKNLKPEVAIPEKICERHGICKMLRKIQ